MDMKEEKNMPYKKKEKKRVNKVLFLCLLLIPVICAGGILGYWKMESDKAAAAMAVLVDQGTQNLAAIQTMDTSHAQLLETTHTRLRDARIAEEERIAEQKRIAEEKRKTEEARIAEEKRKAEEAERLAEQKRKEDEARKKAAEEAAKQQAVIEAEKQKAEAEKNYRATLSVKIKAQEAQAAAENQEYLDTMPAPIVDLAVNAIMQKPALPNGCEVTALAIVLNWMGHSVDKTLLSNSYLPKFPFYTVNVDGKDVRAGGDPNLYFAGDPRNNSNAYYCFAGPIVTAANQFLGEIGASATATDITGSGEDQLISQLDMGYPVIAWGTLSMGEAFQYEPSGWIINEANEKHIPFINLHCVVVSGYDDTFFYIADPIRGNVAVKRSTFMNAYRQIGSRAVVIS